MKVKSNHPKNFPSVSIEKLPLDEVVRIILDTTPLDFLERDQDGDLVFRDLTTIDPLKFLAVKSLQIDGRRGSIQMKDKLKLSSFIIRRTIREGQYAQLPDIQVTIPVFKFIQEAKVIPLYEVDMTKPFSLVA